MHFTHFCSCLNCGAILYDKNPADNAPLYNEDVFNNPKEMIGLLEEPDNNESFYWACPNCNNDDGIWDEIPKEELPSTSASCFAKFNAESYHIYRSDYVLIGGPFSSYDEMAIFCRQKELLLVYVIGTSQC